ncbi:PAQR family membrane homeostasis protein TrhA [Granulicatella seriolae]|uniref:Hemolysin III family protein n=1 Tax=Granulicatella seriolae TaxID=2967226 RepID=A0ABT1WL40_9LACT|nr:hemolysin III family protein [Granulicatella seriolae]
MTDLTKTKKVYPIQSKKSVIVGEVLNAVTHGIGVGLSITALILLILKALQVNNTTALASFIVYGSSLILLFLASTLYHSLKFTRAAKYLQRFDHSSIYVLIAGTYTPFCLLGIGGSFGRGICIAIWAFAIGGIIIETFFLEKLSKISVFLYLAMGWAVIFTIRPLYESIGWGGIFFLVMGGVSYSLGTIFYRKKYNNLYHVLWHLFVLAGAIFMFFAVFYYL